MKPSTEDRLDRIEFCIEWMNELLRAIYAQNRRIMSAISDFAAKVNTAFASIGTSVDGLTQDIQTLNDKITALQNSSGAITPEDQALLDGIQTQAQAVSDKLAALDALTAAPPAP